MYPAQVNSKQTELGVAIDAVQVTIPLVDASLVPDAPNLVTIGTDESAETVLYTGKSGNDLIGVTRGFQGTSHSWALGTKVARYFTAYDHDSFRENIKDNTFESFAGKRYIINNPYSDGGALSLKGQLHCHTTNSDAVDSPTALVTAYKNAGYDFMTITDHNFITENPNVTGMTWIGESCEETYARHIIAYDINERILDSANAQDVINFHNLRGKMTSVAHPNWRGAYILDNREVEGTYNFNFIEVYNAVVSAYGEKQWDYALSSGQRVFATSVDDCHKASDPTQFNKGWVVVFTDSNDKPSILESLRKGNFYASTGNDLTVLVEGNTLTVTSSSTSNFEFIGVRGTTLKTVNGATQAVYEIRGDERYVRVKSTNVSTQKFAWSNPIFIDALNPDNKSIVDMAGNAAMSGVLRDSIINGVFDVWQRGELIPEPVDLSYVADRWQVRKYPGVDGVPPAYTTVQKSGLFGLPDFNDYLTYSISGPIVAGTDGFYGIQQYIEHGTRMLCGYGKKVTVSFLAACSVPGKKIGVALRQGYGTAGSYSTHENLVGGTVTIDNTWKRYSIIINTETTTGKLLTDDYLRLSFAFAWGSSYAAWFGESSPEEALEAMGVMITEVQLSAGDGNLPYNRKTYAEELELCQRFTQLRSTNNVNELDLRPTMRKTPVITGTVAPFVYSAEF